MLSTAQLSAVKSDPSTPAISGLGANTNLNEHTPFSVLDNQKSAGTDEERSGNIFSNFSSDLKSTENQRAASIKETLANHTAGKTSLGQTVFNIAGQVVGAGLMDPANTALKEAGINFNVQNGSPVDKVSKFIADKIMEKPMQAYDQAQAMSKHADDIRKQAEQTTDPVEKAKLMAVSQQLVKTSMSTIDQLNDINTDIGENAKTGEAGVNLGFATLAGAGASEGAANTADTITGAIDKVKGTGEPTITVGGRTLKTGDISGSAHQPDINEFKNSLSQPDQEALANFDHHYSLVDQVDGMKASGQDTSDFDQEYNNRKSSLPEVPEGSTAKIGTDQGIMGTIKDKINAPATSEPGESEQVAADAIKNPLSAKEQQQAFSRGRATVDGVGNKISYEPDQQTINMQKALQPLADDGKIVSPKTAEDQINNSTAVQEAITNKGSDIRTALENSKATWNSNELKGNLEAVNVPDPVKNEPTMIKNATSLKSAAVQLAQDAERDPSGILDLRQDFDQYVKDNYGQNFFGKGRDADPWHSYVYSLRDAMNDMAGYKLPEGSLPDGTPLREALINQSNLINAKEEMSAKFVREYPEASTDLSRFLQNHPLIKRFGLRTAMSVGGTILGLGAINAGIRALESGK